MNPSMNGPLVTLDGVGKTFTLHLRGGTRLGVVDGVSFSVDPGECVVLGGPSGAGKSSLLRMISGAVSGPDLPRRFSWSALWLWTPQLHFQSFGGK